MCTFGTERERLASFLIINIILIKTSYLQYLKQQILVTLVEHIRGL